MKNRETCTKKRKKRNHSTYIFIYLSICLQSNLQTFMFQHHKSLRLAPPTPSCAPKRIVATIATNPFM